MRVKPNKKRTVHFEAGSTNSVTPRSKSEIVITSVKSNEVIMQQKVFFSAKTTTSTYAIKKKNKTYKVLFDYTPVESDELELKVNDVLIVGPNDRSDGGWCSGTNQRTGKVGVFPMNYCELAWGRKTPPKKNGNKNKKQKQINKKKEIINNGNK